MNNKILFSSPFDGTDIEEIIKADIEARKKYLERSGHTDIVIKPVTPDKGYDYALDITSTPPPIAESVMLTPEMVKEINRLCGENDELYSPKPVNIDLILEMGSDLNEPDYLKFKDWITEVGSIVGYQYILKKYADYYIGYLTTTRAILDEQ